MDGHGLTFVWFWVASGFAHRHIAYMKIPFEVQAYARQMRFVTASNVERENYWR